MPTNRLSKIQLSNSVNPCAAIVTLLRQWKFPGLELGFTEKSRIESYSAFLFYMALKMLVSEIGNLRLASLWL